ncbi:hypothetical protein [Acinetobacter sp.]|uniref:hypothetical protein n=1 Tax=Acinetobacter sp. TaxID=472 RepID=UPI0033420B13
MKIKLLSFTIISSLFLTACGGDSAAGDYITNNESEWFSYETGGSLQDAYLFSKVKFSFRNKQMYIDGEYKVDGSTQFTASDLLSNYLAVDGLYDAPKSKTDLGYQNATLKSKSATVWTFTPYSTRNYKQLELIEKFETVNLTGKLISPYINGFDHFAGLNNTLSSAIGPYPAYYVKKLQGKTFPTGSTCLRSISSSTNTPFADLYSNGPINNYQPSKYFQNGYTETKLGNFSLDLSRNIQPNSPIDAVAKIGSDYYPAAYYTTGDYEVLADKIQQYEQDYKDAVNKFGKYSINAQIEFAYLEGLKSECTLFNTTASQAIDAVK